MYFRTICFSLALIFSYNNLQAQDTLTAFFDSSWDECEAEKAVYYRKQVKENEKWRVFDYYLNDTLQMEGLFNDKKASQYFGFFTFYYDNGKKEKEGHYVENKKNDKWLFYYKSGLLKSEKYFENGKQIKASYWYEDGTVGDEKDFKAIMPTFKGGDSELLKYLYGNIKYPLEAVEMDIQGMVVLEFVVDTSGQLTNLKVIRSVHPSIDNEAMRVVMSMPKWNPGMEGGKAVRVSYKLPVKFKLESGGGLFEKLREKRKKKRRTNK